MNEREIKDNIARELKRISALEEKMEDIRFDIEATRKAIEFWKKELDKKSGK